MKLSAGFLFVTLWAATASAQIPNVIQHVQDQMNGVQQQKKAASDDALVDHNTTKAPAGKPAAGPNPAAVVVAKQAATKQAVAKPVAAQLAVKPLVVKQTVVKQTVVKQTVVQQASAKPASAPVAKAVTPAPKTPATKAPVGPVVVKTAPATTSKTPVAAKAPVKQDPFAKTTAPKAVAKATPPPVKVEAKKVEAKKAETPNATNKDGKNTDASIADAKPADSGEDAAEQKKESGYITAGNRRDPFVSPIVQHVGGSGCTTGKRCLAIDQIALRGIVKSDSGMIAVVVNSLDKAYFLRENDPVFNGYVLKISGDTVVFKETVQDKLGHLSTREVVKKITTPAV